MQKVNKSDKKDHKKAKQISSNAGRTRCEVYSRVVGYIRPVSQWNKGKKAEYDQRKEFVAC